MHNSSSSSRKKQPKLSFSSGFRSYVRHFLGTIFVLLRPSVPWCFPIREVSFQQQLKNNSSSSSSSRKKQPKLSFSSGFRSYVRHFLGTIFVLLRPSVPWCFPIREVSFQQQLKNNSSSSSSSRKKQPKLSFSSGFRSYVRHFLGTIFVLSHPGGVL